MLSALAAGWKAQQDACAIKEHSGLSPSWEINGRLDYKASSPAQLAELSGFKPAIRS